MIVKAVSYELTDPTIDSQIIALKASGANVLFDASSPKFAAQAIRKAFELDWRPTHFLVAHRQLYSCSARACRRREVGGDYFRESKQRSQRSDVGE